MPCSCASVQRMSDATEPPRCVCSSARPPSNIYSPTPTTAPRTSRGLGYGPRVKVGIVVPYSWSFWGGVVDHAEQQLLALRELGVDVRLVMGNDPPGSFTHMLHPGLGRHGTPPEHVLPVGRSVIVPANGSLPNIVLTPTTPLRIKRIFEQHRFDLI